jgi:hypothetical protein
MMTVRQIERDWQSRSYGRLFTDLLAARPEAAFRLGLDINRPLPAAALAIIRLDELSQSHVKLYSQLVKAVLAAQESDGGWGDLVASALCIRALLCGNGNGAAIERGLAYLAKLQNAEGIWPEAPIRRMAADPYLSLLSLYQLGDQPAFRKAVRLADAGNWFALHEQTLDSQTRSLWRRIQVRCRLHPVEMALSLC